MNVQQRHTRSDPSKDLIEESDLLSGAQKHDALDLQMCLDERIEQVDLLVRGNERVVLHKLVGQGRGGGLVHRNVLRLPQRQFRKFLEVSRLCRREQQSLPSLRQI